MQRACSDARSEPDADRLASSFRQSHRLRWGLCSLLVCCSLSGCTWVRKYLGPSPEKSHRLAEAARGAEEAGNVPQAVALLEEALEETPNDPHLHRELARLMLSRQNYPAAVEHLEQAVEHNPDDMEANVELAKLYIEHQQPEAAAERLDAALQNDPKHTTALLLRAKLAERLNDPQTAIETYHRVLCCDPNHVEARLRIALLQLEDHQPNLAAPLLRSVCQCSRAGCNEIADARWSLGVAYGQEGRWPDAVETLSAAAEIRPSMSADDWYRLAYARTRLDDWSGARKDLGLRAAHQPPPRKRPSHAGRHEPPTWPGHADPAHRLFGAANPRPGMLVTIPACKLIFSRACHWLRQRGPRVVVGWPIDF